MLYLPRAATAGQCPEEHRTLDTRAAIANVSRATSSAKEEDILRFRPITDMYLRGRSVDGTSAIHAHPDFIAFHSLHDPPSRRGVDIAQKES